MGENLIYNIKEGTEDVIECRGFVSEMTVEDFKKNIAQADKAIKEYSGNAEIQAGIIANIEEHHPFIKEVSAEDLHTYHMYFEAVGKFKAFDNKRKEVEEFKAKEEADLAEVYKQIPSLTPKEDGSN